MKRLENKYAGQDVYVVASGKSCDYIAPDFFEGRVAIGVNQVYKRFTGLDYIVKKDNCESLGIPLVMPLLRFGNFDHPVNQADYLFDHHDNKHGAIDFNVHPHNDKLIVSHSTITSAIHLAAFMGAGAIFLVGHDCIAIEGESNFKGYHEGTPELWSNQGDYNRWLSTIEPMTTQTKEYVMREYGCAVHSINPFVSFRMEGRNS